MSQGRQAITSGGDGIASSLLLPLRTDKGQTR